MFLCVNFNSAIERKAMEQDISILIAWIRKVKLNGNQRSLILFVVIFILGYITCYCMGATSCLWSRPERGLYLRKMLPYFRPAVSSFPANDSTKLREPLVGYVAIGILKKWWLNSRQESTYIRSFVNHTLDDWLRVVSCSIRIDCFLHFSDSGLIFVAPISESLSCTVRLFRK